MGFDVIGENPKSKAGEYFQNNIWSWPPLWNLVCQSCKDILSKDEMEGGYSNDGLFIDKIKAEKIAERLNKLIVTGEAEKIVEEYETSRKATPLEKCCLCKGTGMRNDEFVQGECNMCHGEGKVKPFSTWYPMSLENIKKFAVFCKNSGGYSIS